VGAGGNPVSVPPDPLALLRSRSYIAALLIMAALVGVPVSAVAYFFLALVGKLQEWIFTDLPMDAGFHAESLWWPIWRCHGHQRDSGPHPDRVMRGPEPAGSLVTMEPDGHHRSD
jgi:hypothetical protein